MIPEYLDIPIFPLPNVTFFPKTLLPLHVFEPRYRQMVANALRGDRLIGVALLREGWQKDYFGAPQIHKTFGVGKIIDYVQYDNGTYDIVLEGLYRVRLVAEHQTQPYRTGRVNVLMDGPIDHRRGEVSKLYREIAEDCRRICDCLPEYRESFQAALTNHPHPSVSADVLASTLTIDPYDRQCILEDPDPIRRMKLVLVQLNQILFQLSRKKVEEEVLEEE
jgi:Lon protease-like protein